jgi:hypothetical protein
MSKHLTVYRAEIDALTEKLLSVVGNETDLVHPVDRAIIVAVALGNVACCLDHVQDPTRGMPPTEHCCTRRLKNIVNCW